MYKTRIRFRLKIGFTSLGLMRFIPSTFDASELNNNLPTSSSLSLSTKIPQHEMVLAASHCHQELKYYQALPAGLLHSSVKHVVVKIESDKLSYFNMTLSVFPFVIES